ncbi:hypothetical protein Tco_0442982 [Tanacetum coccineum]
MSQPGNDKFSQHLSNDEASNHEDASDNGAAPKQQQQVIPQTTAISNIKLLILKKEEYDIWAMEMEHYLEYIDNEVWKVILNGNSKKRISTGKDGVIRILPLLTAVEIQAVEKERKAKNILPMAILKEHMRRFYGMDDAKEIWEAIRTRFGGNANSKKMQKAVSTKLEAHDTEVSTEDANHKFLRSLPSAWSNLAMTMRTKPDVDTLSIVDLYNNLTVFEEEALVWFFADEVIYSLFAKQLEDWDLLHEDLEQIDDLDIEEMDINWQIAMIAIRMKKFYKKTGRNDMMERRKRLFINTQEAGKQEKNQIGLPIMDDGIGPQEPEPSVSDDRSSEYSTCQSNDSEGSIGTSSEHSVDPELENSSVPQEVYVSKPVTTNEKGEGYSFTKKKCFVCGSLSHLIKDFDYHEKKMAREAELNKQRVVNTGNGVARPVWTNADRINHANQFVPRPVQLNAGRPNINSIRPNINSGRTNINSVRPRVNTVNSNVNTVRSKQQVPTKISNNFSHKTPQGSAVKTSAGYNWRTTRQNSNCNGGLPLIRTDHPLKNMVDRGIFDSGCSGHMTEVRSISNFKNLNKLVRKPCKRFITNSQKVLFYASGEKDEDAELIVVPLAVKNTEEKVESRKSSTNSKKEEIMTEH